MKEAIFTNKAPKPVGPYSQGIVVDGWIFISGQIPINPKTGELVKGSFRDKARRVLENIKAIAEAAGASMDNIVKVTVYIKDLSYFEELNEIYKEYFKEPYPARVVVQVANLPKDADIEVEAVGYVGQR